MKHLVLLSLIFAASASQAVVITVASERVTCTSTNMDDGSASTFAINIDTLPVVEWIYFERAAANAAKFWCEGVLVQSVTDLAQFTGNVVINSELQVGDEDTLKAEPMSVSENGPIEEPRP